MYQQYMRRCKAREEKNIHMLLHICAYIHVFNHTSRQYMRMYTCVYTHDIPVEGHNCVCIYIRLDEEVR